MTVARTRMEPIPQRTILVTALTPMVWGTTYLVTTELLPAGRPLFAAIVRALPIGLVLLAITRTFPSGRWWLRAAVLGMLNIGTFFALLFVAAFRLPGGVAATAGATQPLLAAGLAAVVLGEPLRRRVVAAGVLGVMGVGLLVLGPGARFDTIGLAAAIAGALVMACGVVLTKHWGRPVDLITFTSWQLVAGGALLAPVAIVVEGVPRSLTSTNVAGFAWLAVVGTGLAYANWFHGVQRLPVGTVSVLTLLSPVVATAAGWAVLDQRLTAVQFLGAALVLAAVVLPNVAHSPVGSSTSAPPPGPLLSPRRETSVTLTP